MDSSISAQGRHNMSDSKVSWVQWTARRTGLTKAFAVDAEALSIDPVRAINGSIVPEDAEPAKRGTEKDEFCVQILASRAEKAARVKARDAAKAARVKEKAKAAKPVRAARKDKGQPRKAKAAA